MKPLSRWMRVVGCPSILNGVGLAVSYLDPPDGEASVRQRVSGADPTTRFRDDGTPEYVMVNRMGPMRASHRSDYVVYEPPLRAEDDTLESALGGRWVTLHEPAEGGTRVTHRWHVEPHGPLKVLFSLIRPGFQLSFQRDLDTMVDRIKAQTTGP